MPCSSINCASEEPIVFKLFSSALVLNVLKLFSSVLSVLKLFSSVLNLLENTLVNPNPPVISPTLCCGSNSLAAFEIFFSSPCRIMKNLAFVNISCSGVEPRISLRDTLLSSSRSTSLTADSAFLRIVFLILNHLNA